MGKNLFLHAMSAAYLRRFIYNDSANEWVKIYFYTQWVPPSFADLYAKINIIYVKMQFKSENNDTEFVT